MAESKARGRSLSASAKKARARSRGKLVYLDNCAVWQAINSRDKAQDARKSQKILKLEKLRHVRECCLQPEVPQITADQLVTLLERFESQEERSHCALMVTFLVKDEPETRTSDIWLEAGVDATVSQICSEVMLAFDLRHELAQHKEISTELNNTANAHLQEAKRIMRLDKKEQDGDAVFQNLSDAMHAKDPVAEQASLAHQKLDGTIQVCTKLDEFCINLETIFGSVLTTCPDEGKDVIRSAAQYIASDIRQHMDDCIRVVAELDALAEQAAKIYNEAEHHSVTFVPPMTNVERQKKMMERKAQADQAYLERMKKKAKDNAGTPDKK